MLENSECTLLFIPLLRLSGNQEMMQRLFSSFLSVSASLFGRFSFTHCTCERCVVPILKWRVLHFQGTIIVCWRWRSAICITTCPRTRTRKILYTYPSECLFYGASELPSNSVLAFSSINISPIVVAVLIGPMLVKECLWYRAKWLVYGRVEECDWAMRTKESSTRHIWEEVTLRRQAPCICLVCHKDATTDDDDDALGLIIFCSCCELQEIN